MTKLAQFAPTNKLHLLPLQQRKVLSLMEMQCPLLSQHHLGGSQVEQKCCTFFSHCSPIFSKKQLQDHTLSTVINVRRKSEFENWPIENRNRKDWKLSSHCIRAHRELWRRPVSPIFITIALFSAPGYRSLPWLSHDSLIIFIIFWFVFKQCHVLYAAFSTNTSSVIRQHQNIFFVITIPSKRIRDISPVASESSNQRYIYKAHSTPFPKFFRCYPILRTAVWSWKIVQPLLGSHGFCVEEALPPGTSITSPSAIQSFEKRIRRTQFRFCWEHRSINVHQCKALLLAVTRATLHESLHPTKQPYVKKPPKPLRSTEL